MEYTPQLPFFPPRSGQLCRAHLLGSYGLLQLIASTLNHRAFSMIVMTKPDRYSQRPRWMALALRQSQSH